jgi:hypothetical protein
MIESCFKYNRVSLKDENAHRFVLERERNKIEIDTYLFVKWNKQIKLCRFRQKHDENYDKKVGQNERHLR